LRGIGQRLNPNGLILVGGVFARCEGPAEVSGAWVEHVEHMIVSQADERAAGVEVEDALGRWPRQRLGPLMGESGYVVPADLYRAVGPVDEKEQRADELALDGAHYWKQSGRDQFARGGVVYLNQMLVRVGVRPYPDQVVSIEQCSSIEFFGEAPHLGAGVGADRGQPRIEAVENQ